MTALKRIAAVAGVEYRIAVRNRWVLLATIILSLFSLALSFPGAGGAGLKADGLTMAAASISTLSVYLVPLIALLVSYDSFAGEVERGTMALVLATPVTRGELLIGKFVGLFAVVLIAIVVGFAVAALTIISLQGANWSGLAVFGKLTTTGALLGAVFIAAGIAISASVQRTGTAAATAIGLWLVVVVLYDLALLAGLVFDGGGFFTKKLFPLFVIANPGDAFRIFNLATIEAGAPVSGLDGLAHTLPFPAIYALGALVLWLVAMLCAGLFSVRRLTP